LASGTRAWPATEILRGADGDHVAIQYHQRTLAHAALAVRLFGNMMSGAMIIAILLTITPFVFPIVMTRWVCSRHGAGLHFQHSGGSVHRSRDAYAQTKPALAPTPEASRLQQGHFMDSMTVIAVASIVIAGITTSFGCLGPALAEVGRWHGTHIARPAARCLRHDHAHPVRGPRDDRVHGHLLFRGVHDPHIRQPVLESRDRSGRWQVDHAHRLVHRRCAGAQLHHSGVVLKRFLYKPIVDAVDARKAHCRELAAADAKKAEAQKDATIRAKNEQSTSSAPRCWRRRRGGARRAPAAPR